MKIIREGENKNYMFRIVDDLPQFGGVYSIEVASKKHLEQDGIYWWEPVKSLVKDTDKFDATTSLDKANKLFDEAIQLLS